MDKQLSFFIQLMLLGILTGTTVVCQSVDESWSKTFTIKEGEYEYIYPEELIDYNISFPEGKVKKEEIKVSINGKEKIYQISEAQENGEFLKEARIHFRTGLNRGEKLIVKIEQEKEFDPQFDKEVNIRDEGNGTAIIYSNKQKVRVPKGNIRFKKAVSASEINAPIIALGREDELLGKGSFMAPEDVLVESIKTSVLEEGPLFVKYRIEYLFNENRSYKVDLTVQYNEQYVLFDEYISGFMIDDSVGFKFSYKKGIDPDGRLFLNNKGYSHDNQGRFPNSGKYDKDAADNGLLPIAIGMYRSGYQTINRATVFWKDSGENGIMFVAYRLKDWKSQVWQVWNALESGLEIQFYDKGDDKFAVYGLNGSERHSAIGILPREEVKLSSFYGPKSWLAVSSLEGLTKENGMQDLDYGAGPEQRLNQKLNDFSLNFVKDIIYDWDIDMTHKWHPATVEVVPESFEKYRYGNHQGEFWRQWVPYLVDFGWDVSGPLGGTCFRHGTKAFTRYLESRNNWTPEEQEKMKNFMIHFIEMIDDYDNAHPYRCMMSGQPNFVIDVLNMLPIASATFPNHPSAHDWTKKYTDYAFPEYLKAYVRKGNSANNALDGMFTENIACYNTTSLIAILHAEEALRHFNGSTSFTEPDFQSWIRYLNYAMVPTGEGKQRYLPPQGAHASPPTRAEEDFKEIATLLSEVNPVLGKNLKYTMGMAGGENPQLESALFNDFGVIFRYKYGTPDEVYLWIQNLFGDFPETTPSSRLYRTGKDYKSTGVAYYAAKENIYSWNGREENGDKWDKDKLTMFVSGDGSLASGPTDNILYNFEFAQFYRTEGTEIRNNYKSRDVMMIRGDYVAFYDDMSSDSLDGLFQWKNTLGLMPNIVEVRKGPGDELHLVSPHTITVKAEEKVYGTLVDGKEYVIISDSTGFFMDGEMKFRGRSGYARDGELAIFEGTSLSLNGFAIERTGGNFGLSAKIISKDRIEGRISGRSGGKVEIKVPKGFRTKNKEVHVLRSSGSSVLNPTIHRNSISFPIDVSQEDGYYIEYRIVDKGSETGDLPVHPEIATEQAELIPDN